MSFCEVVCPECEGAPIRIWQEEAGTWGQATCPTCNGRRYLYLPGGFFSRRDTGTMSDLRPGWWATAEWWTEDGVHAWFAHDCATERVETMLPFPTWRIVDDQRGDTEVNPSVSCEACGLHTFLLSVDRRRLAPDLPEGTQTNG